MKRETLLISSDLNLIMCIKIELLPWKIENAKEFARLANNVNVAKNMRDTFPFPFTEVTAKWLIRDFLESEKGDTTVARSIHVDGKLVGSIAAYKRDDIYSKSCELGYFLGESFWGNGIMTRAIAQICELAFERLDVVRIVAEPFADNIGSRKALEKVGFLLEGVLKKNVYKYGEFYDSCIYALVR